MSDAPPPSLTSARELIRLAQVPEIRGVLIEHARRSMVVQLVLRGVLLAFVVTTIAVAPPANDRLVSILLVVAYALFSVAAFLLARLGDEGLLRVMWASLFVDVGVLGALSLVAIASDATSWTTDILLFGFFVIPVMTATQLRLWVCVVVTVPTVGVYLLCSLLARASNGEPLASVVLRTVVLAGVGLGCLLLVTGQRIRVLRIGNLVTAQARLLDELLAVERRERQDLSEALHDGALQYVLAARQDLDDLDRTKDPESVDRLEHALREASDLLRATVSRLHPAVLEQAGLAVALERLAAETSDRAHVGIRFDSGAWTEQATSTGTDRLLFDTARELLANVAKHARATTVELSLAVVDAPAGSRARLEVRDDGVGLSPGTLASELAAGHVGLASRRTRLEAAGGSLTIGAGLDGRGVGVVAEVPGDTSGPK